MSELENERTTEVQAEELNKATPIQLCVQTELDSYFELLEGEAPRNLHKAVMDQVEVALLNYVMDECRGNQSRASQWLGISRGTLRTKLALMSR